jgi:hypothetical protein
MAFVVRFRACRAKPRRSRLVLVSGIVSVVDSALLADIEMENLTIRLIVEKRQVGKKIARL